MVPNQYNPPHLVPGLESGSGSGSAHMNSNYQPYIPGGSESYVHGYYDPGDEDNSFESLNQIESYNMMQNRDLLLDEYQDFEQVKQHLTAENQRINKQEQRL